MIEGIARADGHKLEHAGIPVAIDHAPGAAIANELGLIPFIHVAHGSLPEVAAVQIQVPIEIKIFVSTETAEFLLLASEVALHFSERLRGIHHWITAALFHGFDSLEN